MIRRRRTALAVAPATAALAAAVALPGALAATRQDDSVATPAAPASTAGDGNAHPLARLAVVARHGGSLLLDASRSRDPDGRIVEYRWDLDGDGVFEASSGARPRVTAALRGGGVHRVGVRAIDDGGAATDRYVHVRAGDAAAASTPRPSARRAARLRAATVAPRKDRPAAHATAAKPQVHSAASSAVGIKDFAFSPTGVTVHVGDTVTWTNHGPTAHSATADNGSFNTGLLKKGTSGSYTFNSAGTFKYHCTPHPFMKASVTVLAAGSSGGGGGGSGSSASGSSAGSSSGSSSAGSSGSSSSLPHTGLELGSLLMAGLALLGSGLALRQRLRRHRTG